MRNSPSPVLDDEPHVEQPEASGRDDEEIHRGDRISVILEKLGPALPPIEAGRALP
jgi:hypothetical protein